MSGQMPDYKRYWGDNWEKVDVTQPVPYNIQPKVRIDHPALGKYLKEKGVSFWDLTREEQDRFVKPL